MDTCDTPVTLHPKELILWSPFGSGLSVHKEDEDIEKLFIDVGGERRGWRQGDVLLFDDSWVHRCCRFDIADDYLLCRSLLSNVSAYRTALSTMGGHPARFSILTSFIRKFGARCAATEGPSKRPPGQSSSIASCGEVLAKFSRVIRDRRLSIANS